MGILGAKPARALAFIGVYTNGHQSPCGLRDAYKGIIQQVFSAQYYLKYY